MANRHPKPHVPDWVKDEREKADHRVQNLTAAQRLWDRVSTDKDRRTCGVTLARAWTPETGLTVGMHCTARDTTVDRALVEVSHALGFLNDRQAVDVVQVQW